MPTDQDAVGNDLFSLRALLIVLAAVS